MLLKGLLDHTPDNHVDLPNLQLAVKAVSQVNVYINKRQKDADVKEDLQWLLKAIEENRVKVLGKKFAVGNEVSFLYFFASK